MQVELRMKILYSYLLKVLTENKQRKNMKYFLGKNCQKGLKFMIMIVLMKKIWYI